jgi:hypothetical protein
MRPNKEKIYGYLLQVVPIIVSSSELNNIIFNDINKNSYVF